MTALTRLIAALILGPIFVLFMALVVGCAVVWSVHGV